MVKRFYLFLVKTIIFWVSFFAIHRFIFVLFNLSYSEESSGLQIFLSFFHGMRMDASITGYMMLLLIVMQLVLLPIRRRFCKSCIRLFSYVFIVLFSVFLLSDTFLFSFWGRHIDIEAIGFLETPLVVLLSLKWHESIGFLVAAIVVSTVFIVAYNKVIKQKSNNVTEKKLTVNKILIQIPVLLFLGGLMIIPIRGGLGVAPLNTGAAYFSSDKFANQSALNPIWNLMYSLKKLDATKRHYSFMTDEKANAIFKELTSESGEFEQIINTPKPNVVVILLESYAAHIIEELGGYSLTPNFSKLCKEGVLFSNIYAASTRSDKGLVATIAGYQVLPSYSIIRHPHKTESLSFLPKKFNAAGYQDVMYMYGGDMGFKNMNSFVVQAGFKRTISMNDFPSEYQGEKWGVQDHYTFDRLAKEMEQAKQPFFHFYFTLSSHEPFDVPMERVFENDYHNSVHYTDRALGNFMNAVKEKGLWDNTLFILLADHGLGGPDRYTHDMKEHNHIPMLWTGGALSVKDTIINKVGSQTDMVKTLLSQIDVDNSGFPFSKNILDKGAKSFAFFDFPDGMGIVEDSLYQVYDNSIERFIQMEHAKNKTDSLKAKAYLQVLSTDHKNR
ncbi:LTA synthase family protein [Carboxylicivirga sp. N1Y90]|uniref:LTA synthase family protein n=1 Tax=Carboxylicivirga fragile TaxID=3417571 RepID=UPI003D342E55|nr:sulfatase-like hydrolase/transferase [Marinilabiliaceae bacterium N1Y90]